MYFIVCHKELFNKRVYIIFTEHPSQMTSHWQKHKPNVKQLVMCICIYMNWLNKFQRNIEQNILTH